MRYKEPPRCVVCDSSCTQWMLCKYDEVEYVHCNNCGYEWDGEVQEDDYEDGDGNTDLRQDKAGNG